MQDGVSDGVDSRLEGFEQVGGLGEVARVEVVEPELGLVMFTNRSSFGAVTG